MLKLLQKNLCLITLLLTFPTSPAFCQANELELLESLPKHLRPLIFMSDSSELDPTYPQEYSLYDKDGAGLEIMMIPIDIMDKELFMSAGDGTEWQMTKLMGGFPFMFTESYAIQDVGSTCTTYNCAETMAIVPYMSKEVCQYINTRENITSASADPPETNIPLEPYPTIRTTNSAAADTWKTNLFQGVITSTAGEINGHETGCVTTQGVDLEGNNINIHVYYTVLHAR